MYIYLYSYFRLVRQPPVCLNNVWAGPREQCVAGSLLPGLLAHTVRSRAGHHGGRTYTALPGQVYSSTATIGWLICTYSTLPRYTVVQLPQAG